MTQEELGRRIGLSYRTIAEWESGRKLPRFDNAVALARELGVSLKVLATAMQINVEVWRMMNCKSDGLQKGIEEIAIALHFSPSPTLSELVISGEGSR
jgi:transcriptional regulator with XRE-family HTH domain